MRAAQPAAPAWHHLTPQQQAAAWARYHAQQAAPVRSRSNPAAIVSLVAGVAGLVVFPLLFGLVAIATGLLGRHLARTDGRELYGAAMAGSVLGVLACLFSAVQFSVL